MRTRLRLLACALVLVSGCGDSMTSMDGSADTGLADGGTDLGSAPDGGTDAGVDMGSDMGFDAGPTCMGPPMLWSDTACSVLVTGVRMYQPEFILWADGASKERYVYLPPGTTIDVTDPDHWVFPVGTRFYKLFGLGTTKLEIRTLVKTMPDPGLASWSVHSYEWSADGMSMTDTTTSGAMNILGTMHDIPTRAQCGQCHGPAYDAILGFSAVQLAHGVGVDLASLNTDGWLSTTPVGGTPMPTTIDPATAEIPGDATVRPALGYLHANCSQCHHGSAAPAGLKMDVLVGITDPYLTQTYLTAVGHPTTGFMPGMMRVAPGMPDASMIPYRMNHRGDTAQMPPLGTEMVDATGLATVRTWIAGIP